MSSSIWTQCAAASEVAPLRATAWRAVEAQHQVATRKLVDSDREQQLLEELLDESKPALHLQRRLHYLLSTPFRYPPLRHGSRFATRFERGVWYGSESVATMFAEVAYYRFVFLDGSAADLGVLEMDLTVFNVSIRAERALDLTVGPFATHRAAISSRTEYGASQALGSAMRDDGVQAFRYFSARDIEGTNIGVIDERAFTSYRPKGLETWHSVVTGARIEFSKRDYFRRETLAFDRSQFMIDGVLPAPAL
jgi:hypothetical protein